MRDLWGCRPTRRAEPGETPWHHTPPKSEEPANADQDYHFATDITVPRGLKLGKARLVATARGENGAIKSDPFHATTTISTVKQGADGLEKGTDPNRFRRSLLPNANLAEAVLEGSDQHGSRRLGR